MNPLDPGYVCEFDQIDSDLWHELMLQFDDASYYQTWAFGAVHSGETRLSHVVLKANGTVVGMAQARIARVPGCPIGIAYITKGPMWQRKDGRTDLAHLRNMLRALHHGYVVDRGFYLRIVPNLIDSAGNVHLKDVFREEGFVHKENPLETVVLDLSIPLEDIRRNLSKGWRRSLHSAEKRSLGIMEGTDHALCGMAMDIFREMKKRKGFFGGDQGEPIEVHKRLPERLKLHFMVCTDAGEPVAALACATFGSTGVPLVGATGNKALEVGASHLLWWKMIDYYKGRGVSALDTNVVNKQRNPGGYHFKTQILGRGFKEPVRYFGYFDACRNPLSKALFKTIYLARDGYREMGRKLAGRKPQRAEQAPQDRRGADGVITSLRPLQKAMRVMISVDSVNNR